jgi:putative oxidoreductase
MTLDTAAQATAAQATAAQAVPAATRRRMPVTRAGARAAGQDAVALLARVGLAVLMIWHVKLAWDYTGGVAGMVAGFDQMGIPAPELTARFNLFGELIGGILLIVGFGVRTTGALMALNMLGAWYYVHTSGLYAMDHNGPELSIALALLSLMLAATGPGRASLEHLRRARRS